MQNRFFTISVGAFMAASIAMAAPKSENSVQVRRENAGSLIRVTVDVGAGFHVNEKAPNNLQILPPEKDIPPKVQETKRLVFEVAKKDLPKNHTLWLSSYICDDALTVCENREWRWNAQGAAVSGETPVTTAAKPAEAKTTPAKNQFGFYKDDLPAALRECGARKQRVMLLFSARWCPGCIRLEQEVWSDQGMKKTLNEFVKVKLDADRFENKALMKTYGVAGIPTTLILNCQGEELSRLVDYMDRDHMRSVLTVLARQPLETRVALERQAQEGDQAAILELAQRAAQSYQVVEALRWFEKRPDRESRVDYWLMKTMEADEQAAKDPANEAFKKNRIAVLSSALQKFPRTMSSLDWRLSLAQAQGTETADGKKTLEALLALTDSLIADRAAMENFVKTEPSGDYLGIESLRVYQARAEALEALKKSAEAQAAWAAAVAEGGRLGIKDAPSGPFYRFLPILKKAGEQARLKNFFHREAARKKADGELLRRYAKYLLEQGDFKEAVKVSERALKDAYGRNEILAALVYAQSLGKIGQAKEAKQFLLKYQARQDLTDDAREQIRSTLGLIE